jgi:hypothetical protein
MHERYGNDGLVCMSLSVDPPGNKPFTLNFLQSQRARFANYFLQARPGDNPWNVTSVPLIVVYDRTGRLAARIQDARAVEPLVRKLLGQDA